MRQIVDLLQEIRVPDEIHRGVMTESAGHCQPFSRVIRRSATDPTWIERQFQWRPLTRPTEADLQLLIFLVLEFSYHMWI